MVWSIGISIYCLIGALIATAMYFYVNHKIESFEAGETLEQEDIKRLEETSDLANKLGEKGYLAFLFMLCTLFWLPMLLFNPKK